MEELKICRECGESKNCNDFPIDTRNRDGRRGICRNCDNEKQKNRRSLFTETKKINESCFSRPRKKSQELLKINSDFIKLIDMAETSNILIMRNVIQMTLNNLLQKAQEMNTEYNDIMEELENAPENTFSLTKEDINIAYKSLSKENFMIILQSKLQLWLALNKQKICDVKIQYKNNEYIVCLPDDVLLKKEEIHNFLHDNVLI